MSAQVSFRTPQRAVFRPGTPMPPKAPRKLWSAPAPLPIEGGMHASSAPCAPFESTVAPGVSNGKHNTPVAKPPQSFYSETSLLASPCEPANPNSPAADCFPKVKSMAEELHEALMECVSEDADMKGYFEEAEPSPLLLPPSKHYCHDQEQPAPRRKSLFGDGGLDAPPVFDFKPKPRPGSIFDMSGLVPRLGASKLAGIIDDGTKRETTSLQGPQNSSSSKASKEDDEVRHPFGRRWKAPAVADKVTPHLYCDVPGVPYQLPVTVVLATCEELEKTPGFCWDNNRSDSDSDGICSGGSMNPGKKASAGQQKIDKEVALTVRHKLSNERAKYAVSPVTVKAIRLWWAAKRDW